MPLGPKSPTPYSLRVHLMPAMRALILPLLAALSLGFMAQNRSQKVLRVTTVEERSIVVYSVGDEGGEVRETVIGNRTFIVCVPQGTRVAVNDLDSPEVRARLDDDQLVWEGNLEIRLVRGDEVESRFRVRGGTVVFGPETEVAPGARCDLLGAP